MGQAGNALLMANPTGWEQRLSALRSIDWSRSNACVWEGRALVGGKVVKGNRNLALTVNVIKQALALPLDQEQQRAEDTHRERRAAVAPETKAV